MSFPPRPPMGMHGMHPMAHGMVPTYALTPMTSVVPMGVIATPLMPPGVSVSAMENHMMRPTPNSFAQAGVRRPFNNYKRQGHGFSSFRNKQSEDGNGPTVTVFVGNITERAPDQVVKQLLQRCGTVSNWKRVQGASGKLQAFGFCEYADPESALRAIRILHDWEIADKKLVVKVDPKAKTQLDEYKASKSKEGEEKEEKDGGEEELDEETQQADRQARNSIQNLLKDHEYELSKPVVNEQQRKRGGAKPSEPVKPENDDEPKDPKDQTIDELDMEDDKKQIISREIDKFRDCMKKLEEQKEREKKDKEKREAGPRGDRGRDREERENSYTRRLRGPVSPDRVKRSSKERTRDRSRSRSRDRPVSRSERQRSRERERERKRSPIVTRKASPPPDRPRDRDRRGRDKEDEEEAAERRKLERKLHEKEASYQERLRLWESREGKKGREYDRKKEKDDARKYEENREARRLKEFLEDYDDDRDDIKYYRGNALARRLKEREKEIESDGHDRQKEKEELEELRVKLKEEGHPDPQGEVERIQREQEEQYRPKIKVEPKAPRRPSPKVELISSPDSFPDDRSARRRPTKVAPPVEEDSTQHSLSEFSDVLTPADEVKPKPIGFSALRIGGSSPHQQPSTDNTPQLTPPTSINGKRKKLSVGDIFNQDDDDSSGLKGKKKKLSTLEDDATDSSTGGTASQEEKRKHIKTLIDKIPTEKDQLFAYTVDWTLVDSNLMDRRIKPWINKKIVEYIGEEEPSLVEFICSKLLAHSLPPSILEDVQMVLDDEAEVFVVKMWRLLIYEIESKKLGRRYDCNQVDIFAL